MKRILWLMVCLVFVWNVSAARKVTWVIDAGHGGHDVGCEGNISNEKEITLAVAKEVGRLVKRNIKGVRVVFTRERDKFLSLQERCDIANRRGAELFISIHVNSASNPFARGTESFFATNVPLRGTQAGKSELLALLLQRQYLSHGREISRGVKKRELYVCEHTNMPSVLTEIGFISNMDEEEYLNSQAGQKELAMAIYSGLKEWKELTKGGAVPKAKLRNLRFTHYAPLTMEVKEPEPVKVVAPTKESEKPVLAVVDEEKVSNEGAKKSADEVAVKEEAEKTETEQVEKAAEKGQGQVVEPKESGRPYFAIQLMNVATELKDGDYRLKGFTGVRFIPADGRFKAIYGRYDKYKDIKNELAQVRETFPEAFIVAFKGERQITTAEALEMLKR